MPLTAKATSPTRPVAQTSGRKNSSTHFMEWANERNVWAVGASGTILRWNGADWSLQQSGTDKVLRDVWGTEASNAWAVGDGGIILRWNGTVWSQVASGTEERIFRILGKLFQQHLGNRQQRQACFFGMGLVCITERAHDKQYCMQSGGSMRAMSGLSVRVDSF